MILDKNRTETMLTGDIITRRSATRVNPKPDTMIPIPPDAVGNHKILFGSSRC